MSGGSLVENKKSIDRWSVNKWKIKTLISSYFLCKNGLMYHMGVLIFWTLKCQIFPVKTPHFHLHKFQLVPIFQNHNLVFFHEYLELVFPNLRLGMIDCPWNNIGLYEMSIEENWEIFYLILHLYYFTYVKLLTRNFSVLYGKVSIRVMRGSLKFWFIRKWKSKLQKKKK